MKIYDDLSKQRELFQEIESLRDEDPYKEVNVEFATYKFEPQYLIALFEIIENKPEEVCGSNEVLDRVRVSFINVTHAREIIDKVIYNSMKDLLLARPTAMVELFLSKGFSYIYVPVKIKKLNEKPTYWHILPVSLDSSSEEVKKLYDKGRMSQLQFESLQTECQKTIDRKSELASQKSVYTSSDLSEPSVNTSSEMIDPENLNEAEDSATLSENNQNGWEKRHIQSFLDMIPAMPTNIQLLFGFILGFIPLCLIISRYGELPVIGYFWLFAYVADYLGIRLITPFATAFWFGWAKAPWWMPPTAQIRNIFIEKKLEGNSVKWELVEFSKKCQKCHTDRPLEVEHKPVYSLRNFSASCREKRAYHQEDFVPF